MADDALEKARTHGLSYGAFVDPSGGSSDSMTLAIGHAQLGEDKKRSIAVLERCARYVLHLVPKMPLRNSLRCCIRRVRGAAPCEAERQRRILRSRYDCGFIPRRRAHILPKAPTAPIRPVPFESSVCRSVTIPAGDVMTLTLQ